MSSLLLSLLLVLVLLLSLSWPLDGELLQGDPLVVSTDCGDVQGTWQTVPASPYHPIVSQVGVWRSIPYAAPPMLELRWMSPQLPKCWAPALYDATEFNNFCTQTDGTGNEDCLYLNVYVPQAHLLKIQEYRSRTKSQPSSAESSPPLLPVLFYIHGGGLMGGSGNFEPLAPFSSHAGPNGVVVVSINYRLNIFGFLCIEQQEQAQCNFGIQDQQLALQWLQKNIANFGGDPSKVTLAGQSSGGTSIFALLSSSRSVGLFSGAIALSGSINVSMSLSQAYAQNGGMAVAAGCSQNTSSDIMACMRGATVSALLGAIPPSWTTPGMWGITSLTPAGMGANYGGLVVVDHITITMGFADALANALIDVPIIFGNMGQENDLNPDVDVYNYTASQWHDYFYTALQSWGSSAVTDELWQLYQNSSSINPAKAYCDFNTDYGLTCGTPQIAVNAKLGAYSSPIYIYVNEWAPSTPVPLGGRSAHFAFHTWDYSAAIENYPSLNWIPNQQDWALSELQQQIWYSFMDTGKIDSSFHWYSVEDVDGFPNNYSTFVYEPSGSGNVTNYKSDTCNVLSNIGFNDEFWWCD